MAWVWPCVNIYSMWKWLWLLQLCDILWLRPLEISGGLVIFEFMNVSIYLEMSICQVMCEYLYQQESKVMTIHSHLGQTANQNLQGWASEHDLVHDGPIFLFFFHFYLKLMLYHWNLQRHVGIVSYTSQTWVRNLSSMVILFYYFPWIKGPHTK